MERLKYLETGTKMLLGGWKQVMCLNVPFKLSCITHVRCYHVWSIPFAPSTANARDIPSWAARKERSIEYPLGFTRKEKHHSTVKYLVSFNVHSPQGGRIIKVQALAPWLSWCRTLDKLFNYYKPQCSHLLNGNKKLLHLTNFCEDPIKHPAFSHLIYSRYYYCY